MISPEVILPSRNVVGDVEHVCIAQTSLVLAERLAGRRQYIFTTLGAILLREDKLPSRKAIPKKS